jgi:hypothetical protein
MCTKDKKLSNVKYGVRKKMSLQNLENTLTKVNDVLAQYPHLQKYFPFVEVDYMSRIPSILKRVNEELNAEE